MIIWRGWGILAVPVAALGIFGLGGILALLVSDGELTGLSAGIAMILTAPLMFVLGSWLNNRTRTKAAEQYRVGRGAELDQYVAQQAELQTHREMQGADPQWAQQNWNQRFEHNRASIGASFQQQFEQETAEVVRRFGNQHTLFFIPMQWLVVPLVVGGLIAILASLTS